MVSESSRLRTIYLEILHGCNLRCSYCYIGDDKNHSTPYVAPALALRKRLNSLSAFGVPEVILLGGEPLLHPDLSMVLTDVAALGFGSRGVVTNGTALTPARIQLLKAHGFWVNITLRQGS